MNKPLLATILTMSFLAFIPPAEAATPCDGTFQANAIFDIPDSCNGWTQSGSGDVSVQANPVVDANNPSSKVLRTNGPSFMFDVGDRCTGSLDYDLLSDTAVAGIGVVISTHTLATGGAAAETLMGITQSGSTVQFSYDNNPAGAGAAPVGFSPAFTLATNTWYHFHYECNNEAPRLRVTVTGGTSGAASVSQGIGDTASQKYFRFSRSAGSLYVDNLQIATSASNGNRFCANVADNFGRFGYNYKEGVTFTDVPDPGDNIGLGDWFKFEGNSGDFHYLAKSNTAGSTFVETKFTIEAAEESENSLFRTSYSFVSPTSYTIGSGNSAYLNGPSDVGADAKGNGLTTEMFSDQVEVEFRETANTWVVQLYETNGGTRQIYGAAVPITSPNNFQGFSFVLDTVANYIAVEDDTGTSFINRTVSGMGGTYTGDEVRTVWHIGAATDFRDARTALNDNDGDFHSTCIYALSTWDNLGTDGTTDTVVGNTTETPSSITGAGGALGSGILPDGFTVAGYNLLLAMILTLGLAGGLYVLVRSPTGAILGAVGGFGLSIALALVPTWFIIVVTVISVAIIFIQIKGRVASGA